MFGFSYSMLILILFLSSVCLSAPPLPSISETFSSHVDGKVIQDGNTSTLTGQIYRSYFTKDQLISMVSTTSGRPKMHTWELDRHFLYKKSYSFTWVGDKRGNCTVDTLTDPMPQFWSWIKNATYNNTITYENHPVDVFVLKDNNSVQSVGVARDTRDVPCFFTLSYKDINTSVEYRFSNFTAFPPDEGVFAIPKNCTSSGLWRPTIMKTAATIKIFKTLTN